MGVNNDRHIAKLRKLVKNEKGYADCFNADKGSEHGCSQFGNFSVPAFHFYARNRVEHYETCSLSGFLRFIKSLQFAKQLIINDDQTRAFGNIPFKLLIINCFMFWKKACVNLFQDVTAIPEIKVVLFFVLSANIFSHPLAFRLHRFLLR